MIIPETHGIDFEHDVFHSRPHSPFVSFLLVGLARENEGLWGHRIFELNRTFLIGCLEQRIPKRKSKM